MREPTEMALSCFPAEDVSCFGTGLKPESSLGLPPKSTGALQVGEGLGCQEGEILRALAGAALE